MQKVDENSVRTDFDETTRKVFFPSGLNFKKSTSRTN